MKLEQLLAELRWKKAPASLDRRVMELARRQTRRPWIRLFFPAAVAAVLLALIFGAFFTPRPDAFAVVVEAPNGTIVVGTPVAGRIEAREVLGLKLSDGSRVKLNTGAVLEISGWSWKLIQGELWAWIDPKNKPHLTIDTPTARAVITGTEFNLKATPQRTLLAVASGSVVFNDVKVPAKHQAQAIVGEAPRVVPLVHESRVFHWARQFKGVRRHPVEKSMVEDGGAIEGSVGTLTAEGKPLALRRQTVQVDIDNGIATTLVEQVFYNDTPRRLEGTFRFPLPPNASIFRFAMTVTGDQLVEGRIVEKQRARRIYESIVRRMEDPGLLEWQEGNLFQTRIFPIEPHREKRIVIGFTQVLPFRDGAAKYVYPLVSEALSQNPPERFALQIQGTFQGKVWDITSPSHNVDLARKDEHQFRSSFEASLYTPLNDFVLTFRVEQPELSVLRQDDVFLMRLSPHLPAAPPRTPAKFLFVLDSSYSMTPALREIQYNILEQMLGKLSPEDRFDIALVDVSTRFVFGKWVADREKALSTVWGMETGGATDFEAAFAALANRLTEAATVVYIGDGVPTIGLRTAPELVKAWSDGPGKWVDRFVAIGLGSGVNRTLLDALAAHRGGTVHVLTPGENLVEQVRSVSRIFDLASLRDIKVDYNGAHDVYPRRFATLLQGDELVLVGRGEKLMAVRVTGRAGDKPFEFSQSVGDAAESKRLARVWAQHRLADLSLDDVGGRHKDELVKLSEQYTIMTPYTSLLVLESEEEFKKYQIAAQPELTPKNPIVVDAVTTLTGKGREDDDWGPADRRNLQQRKSALDGALEDGTAGVKRLEELQWEDSKKIDLSEGGRRLERLRRASHSEKRKEALDELVRRNKLKNVDDLIHFVELGTSDEQRDGLATLRRLAPERSCEEAIAIYRLLTRYAPGERQLWLELGDRLDALHRRAEALRAWTTIVEIDPNDATARCALADVFAKLGDSAATRRELEEARRLRPDQPASYLKLAEIAERESRFADAEREYLALLKYDLDPQARPKLIDLYTRMGGHDAMIAKLRRGDVIGKDVKIVLSWDTDKTDVDLHVSAPTEEQVTYQHKASVMGGKLDRDVTTGFGPETYTFPDYRSGSWLIEVDYFAGSVVTTGRVEIVLFEGTSRETRRTIPFKLEKQKQKVTIWSGELR